MKVTDTIRRSGRNLRSAKLRTFLTALAISVGGFTLALTLGASQGARNYTQRLISANFDPTAVFVAKDKSLFGGASSGKPREYSSDLSSFQGSLLKQFNQEDIAKIKALPHVKQVIQNYDISAQFITRLGAKKYTGSLNVYDSAQKPQLKAGIAPTILKDDAVLLPDDYLAPLNFNSPQAAIGKTIIIQVRQPSGLSLTKNYTVAGVTTKSTLSLDLNTVGPYVSENEARQLNAFINAGSSLADHVPTVLVRGDGASADTLKQEIVGAGFDARTAKDLQSFLDQIVNILQVVILVFGAITLIASFFGVVNTQYISVLERTREIGLMKALGMSRRAVSFLFVIEASWIGLLGAGLGAVGAIIVGTLLNPWITKKLNFGSEHLLVFKPAQLISLIVFLMIITTIAGLLPARKASKLDPIEALRTE